MGTYVASELINAMKKNYIQIKNAKILIMGLTFKENCPDLRNSGVSSIINELKSFKCDLDLYDPWANSKEIRDLYGIEPKIKLIENSYDAIILAVAHNKFKRMGSQLIRKLGKKMHIIYDLKYLFTKEETNLRL